MMSSMYAQYDYLISLCRVCLISLYLSKTFGHCVFLNFVWSLRLERMSLRMLRVTQVCTGGGDGGGGSHWVVLVGRRLAADVIKRYVKYFT